MYRRYNDPPNGRYSVRTVEAILDNCFTELLCCGLSCYPLAASISDSVKTMEGNGNS